MLEEAVEVIRSLWEGGVKSHRGRDYRVEHCQVYDLPATPPPRSARRPWNSQRGSATASSRPESLRQQ
jgi:alkanesulfonate monooxygenase SsuD/methylene tetrahydromethanopterin reductase-like flavin-dependent oxidoreductase (luciferase family)